MREVKEISAGAQFSRSSENGRVADSGTRVFKILLDNPGEVIDLQKTCNVYIGNKHPFNPQIFCTSFDARFDGESRMVILCTFQYASAASSDSTQDRREKAPDVRPANWSVASTLTEAPAWLWKPIGHSTLGGNWQVPVNTVGDRYDGISRVEPLITYSIEQYESEDPNKHALLAGVLNVASFQIGTFKAPQRTLMFRGVHCQPVVESWGEKIYRGWKATYEFVYKRGYAGEELGDIGWDVAIPQTGFNIKNTEAALGGGVHEVGSLLLAHDSSGKITDWPADPSLAPGTNNKKVRGMVLVHAYADGSGGASQLPCAQPIALNDDGTPRSSTATPPVKVYRYQVQPEYDFNNFGIRLF